MKFHAYRNLVKCQQKRIASIIYMNGREIIFFNHFQLMERLIN